MRRPHGQRLSRGSFRGWPRRPGPQDPSGLHRQLARAACPEDQHRLTGLEVTAVVERHPSVQPSHSEGSGKAFVPPSDDRAGQFLEPPFRDRLTGEEQRWSLSRNWATPATSPGRPNALKVWPKADSRGSWAISSLSDRFRQIPVAGLGSFLVRHALRSPVRYPVTSSAAARCADRNCPARSSAAAASSRTE